MRYVRSFRNRLWFLALGRLIDHDQAASMEKKKQEGYF